jgi:hypothetical protein
MTPHYPPLYPAVIYLFEKFFGINPGMLKTLLFVQHLFLALSLTYVASALRYASRALIMSIAATAGAYFGAFAHIVATQGFDAPFLALMTGVALRYHFEGWRLTLLPVFIISVFGLAMTRHADVVLAVVVPAYWVFRALYAKLYYGRAARPPLLGYLGNAVICCLGVALVIVIIGPIQHLTCRYFGRDCPYSIVGRAGCYRISRTRDLVPAEQQAGWIADKTAKLNAAEAFAFRAMAVGENCWTGPYNNIAKSFPNENQDMLMNSAFLKFLLRPDRFSTEQMLGDLRGGLHLDRSSYFEYASLERLLWISAQEVARDDDSMHREMRVRLGAEGSIDGPYMQALMKNPFVKAYAWYTYYLLNLIGATGLVILMIFDRRPSVVALGTSIAIGCLVYLVSVTTVTIMVFQYELPVDFLLYVWTGILGCVLVDAVVSVFRREKVLLLNSP